MRRNSSGSSVTSSLGPIRASDPTTVSTFYRSGNVRGRPPALCRVARTVRGRSPYCSITSWMAYGCLPASDSLIIHHFEKPHQNGPGTWERRYHVRSVLARKSAARAPTAAPALESGRSWSRARSAEAAGWSVLRAPMVGVLEGDNNGRKERVGAGTLTCGFGALDDSRCLPFRPLVVANQR